MDNYHLDKFAQTFELHDITIVFFARSVATAYTPTVFELLMHALANTRPTTSSMNTS